VDQTYSFLRSLKAYKCPSEAYRYGTLTGQGYFVTAYNYAAATGGYANGTNLSRLLKVVEFRKPTSKVYFADSGYVLSATAPQEAWNGRMSVDATYSGPNASSPSARHNGPRVRKDILGVSDVGGPTGGGYNAAFFDGHAGFLEWRPTVSAGFSGVQAVKRNTWWAP
jgi:prepilin-type processing-associated H-X9-DG protein